MANDNKQNTEETVPTATKLQTGATGTKYSFKRTVRKSSNQKMILF